jgi:hypothetical protein
MAEPIIFQIIDWSQFHENEPVEADDELDELQENDNIERNLDDFATKRNFANESKRYLSL